MTDRCESTSGLISKQESSESESESESEDEESESEEEVDELQNEEELQQLLQMQQLRQLQLQQGLPPPPIPQQQRTLSGLDQLSGLRGTGRPGLQLDFGTGDAIARLQTAARNRQLKALGLDANGKQLKKEKKEKKKKRGSKMEYKRVDQLWDNTIHNYKLQDTAEGKQILNFASGLALIICRR